MIVEAGASACIRAVTATTIVHFGPSSVDAPGDGVLGPPLEAGHGVHVIPLPDELDWRAFMAGGCGMPTALHAVTLAEIAFGDIVVVQGLTGRIEEITLTYVSVRVQDNTTLILPCTYFTTTPFQNYTHQGAHISAVVEIGVTVTRPWRPSLPSSSRTTLPRCRAARSPRVILRAGRSHVWPAIFR